MLIIVTILLQRGETIIDTQNYEDILVFQSLWLRNPFSVFIKSTNSQLKASFTD